MQRQKQTTGRGEKMTGPISGWTIGSDVAGAWARNGCCTKTRRQQGRGIAIGAVGRRTSVNPGFRSVVAKELAAQRAVS